MTSELKKNSSTTVVSIKFEESTKIQNMQDCIQNWETGKESSCFVSVIIYISISFVSIPSDKSNSFLTKVMFKRFKGSSYQGLIIFWLVKGFKKGGESRFSCKMIFFL